MVISSASAFLHVLSTVGGSIVVHPKNPSTSASMAMPSPGVTPLNINLDQVGTLTSAKFESSMCSAISGRIAPVISATNA